MRIIVVHGPPLSGKTTYVRQNMARDDLVFDFDLVMAALAMRPAHDHNDLLIGYVLDIRGLIINRLRRERRLAAELARQAQH